MRGLQRVLTLGHVLLLTAAVAAAAVLGAAEDWRPFSLFWLLGGLTLLSGAWPIEFHGVKASGSFVGVILAAVLLGPAPGLAIALATMLAQAVVRRPPWRHALCNFSAFATFAVSAAALAEGADALGALQGPLGMPFVVFAIFLVTNVVNFLVVAADVRITEGAPVRRSLVEVYVPCLPVECASAGLTAALAYSYQRLGVGVVMMVAAVALAFQYLLHLSFEANRRGEALETRTRELAALQVGLLSTVLRTLSLRDKMTARHSAAVARYARAIAEAIGLPAREQELIHTAALLHDIGKFVFPDSILSANRKLTDEDFEIVKRHPQAGADLVRSIDGYGPVAEIVLAHHERIDGRGYPNGLRGEDIPIGSRIISVCDTFDVMTSRDSYQVPVTRAKAFTELRRVSGAQLDARLVEVFIALVEHEGIAFRHTDDVDFEHELDLSRRVREHAAPREAA